MEFPQLISFNRVSDERGELVFMEENSPIPFRIQRVYYIFNTLEGKPRGFHCHRHSEQVVICLRGQCRVVVDDGWQRKDVVLASPDQGVLIQGMLWREIHDLTADCLLLVLASETYDPTDYIYDYDDFISHARSQQG